LNSSGSEFRHLNAAGLPDSIYYSYSKEYIKLLYTSQNNPHFKRDYRNDTLYRESRWTYDPDESTSVPNVKAEHLEFYPNPANDKIQLRGITQGNYRIFNVAGQLMQSGTVQNGGSIPVQLLIPGMYTLSVQGTNRQLATATFVKQ
jgi:hypothetical protein